MVANEPSHILANEPYFRDKLMTLKQRGLAKYMRYKYRWKWIISNLWILGQYYGVVLYAKSSYMQVHVYIPIAAEYIYPTKRPTSTITGTIPGLSERFPSKNKNEALHEIKGFWALAHWASCTKTLIARVADSLARHLKKCLLYWISYV